MKHASLASHYRPQTFAQVTGQEMITTVLSRATAEESIAPAYLLSGTRGVGKTTIARIFAKALNCKHAPTSEPCNACDQCQKITQGNHVDVTEIDGASNNSVDDARALREHIGYAAMEGRYKVFIIDEAHMLSRSAFNALLKTLEEPPPRVVFIFATTEVHKFPITIVSRCQHFIFKRLSEEKLVDHLTHVLEQENIEHEGAAVRLIARRAAGSVRDGMSLLGQSLALGEKVLSLETTRMVLGLAGQEFFHTLIKGIAANDCSAIIQFSKELSEQGVDIGFFLRELTSLWRTLFLLREAGKDILPSLTLSDDEAKLWLEVAPIFSAAHLHAAWHMTLDAQRKVIHSPEPAAALELLLLNLALMPRLLPIAKVDDANLPSTSQPPVASEPKEEIENSAEKKTPKPNVTPITQNVVPEPEPQPIVESYATPEPELLPENSTIIVENAASTNLQQIENIEHKPVDKPTWSGFCEYIAEQGKISGKDFLPSHILHQTKGIFSENALQLNALSGACFEKLQQAKPQLQNLCADYCGNQMTINIVKAVKEHKPESLLKQEFAAREDMQDCLEILDASIIRVSPMDK